MTALLGLNDNVLELNDHSLITSLLCSHYASMSLPLTRHFAHYAAMGPLDTLCNYLKLNTKVFRLSTKGLFCKESTVRGVA